MLRCLAYIGVAGAAACVGPSPVETGPDAELLFLTPVTRPTAAMQALYQGRVHVDQEGCFRLSDDPGAHTVIWPYGHGLARDQASLVITDESGREAGRVGHLLALSGGETQDLAATGRLSSEMLEAAFRRCPGGYWIAGEVLPPTPRP